MEDTRLLGKENKKKHASLTFKNILDGSFQRSFAGSFERKSGLFGYLVKTDHQINFSLFKQISSGYRSKVVLGKENTLIEKAYLKSANGISRHSLKKLRKKAARMKELQDFLNSKGVKLLYLISASKPGLYPEIIPGAYRLKDREKRKNDYQKMVPLLKKYKINFLDGHKLLENLKQTTPYPVFAKSGTHWNSYAACIVSNRVVDEMEKLLKADLNHFSCRIKKIDQTPLPQDRDLAGIANLWNPRLTYSAVPRPENTAIYPDSAYKPDVLFVGTSFLWSILKYLDYHRVFHKRNMYYYFKRDFGFPKRYEKPINRTTLDWNREVFSRDIIIIEFNEAFMARVGYGFIKDALLKR